jgi:hypothetical protein
VVADASDRRDARAGGRDDARPRAAEASLLDLSPTRKKDGDEGPLLN